MHIHVPKWYHTKPWTRHGLILVTAGIIYSAIGVMYMLQPATRLREENLKFALAIMPYFWWGFGFLVVGVATIISSRWPALPKSFGYSFLSGWTAAWSGVHVFGGASTGNMAYIAAGFSWAMIAFLWWAVSGLWPPPKERMSGGYIDPVRDSISGVDRSALCLRDAEAGITSESPSSSRWASERDGDGGLSEGQSVRHGDDNSPERASGGATERDRSTEK